MRENRLSGSEGGGAKLRSSLPLSVSLSSDGRSQNHWMPGQARHDEQSVFHWNLIKFNPTPGMWRNVVRMEM
jgi:hypothetical protein